MRITVYSSCSTYPLIEAKKNKNKPRKDSAKAAARITSNVKLNLKILKELKKDKTYELKPRTRFRRKKGGKESKDFLLDDPDLDNIAEEIFEDTGDPVTLIDGYNLCGFWDKLKPDFKAGRLECARDKLLIPLIKYSKITGERIVVVYDARKSGNGMNKDNFFGVDIVFSGKLEADDWILQEVEALREAHHPVLVVTSDVLMQNESIEMGASVWSCGTFIKTMQDSEEALKQDRLKDENYNWPIILRKRKKKKKIEDQPHTIDIVLKEEPGVKEDVIRELYTNDKETFDALYNTDKRFW